jgi:GAF domain-containing protein
MIGMLEPNDVLKDLQDLRDSGFLSDALLRKAVKDIAAADDRFDWVGVYLVNSEENVVWLHNYVGRPTPHSKIPVGEGVCGTAVAGGQDVIVPDVKALDHYIVCDPLVKSEMVVLIRGGDEIFGLIDLDSRTEDAFTDEDATAVQLVADKLAEQLVHERN